MPRLQFLRGRSVERCRRNLLLTCFGALSLGVASNVAAKTGEAAAESLTLPTITVTSATGSGYAQEIQDAPASISVITREDIEGKSYRDITEALQSVPGLYVNDGPTGKGGTEQISLRGLDPEYTLILVDGKAQGSQQAYYNGYGRGSEFGWLPPMSAIERIEIIRGPMSSLYGSDALGGVINVITRDVPETWGGTVTVDRTIQEDDTSGDRSQQRYYLSGPLIENTLGLSVYGSRFDRDEDSFPGGYQGYTREDVTGELKWTPNEANEFALEAGYATQDSTGSADAAGVRGNDSSLERIRRHQALTHELTWGERLLTKSYVQREQLEQDDASYQSSYERTTANTSTVVPFDSNVLTVGAQYRMQEIHNDPERAYGEANLERWDAALFAEDEWYVTDAFTLTTGLRWVDDENYGSEIVPRVYGVYALTPQLNLVGGVSAGYRTPDLKEGDSNWIEGGGGPRRPGGRDIGNSDLLPEESLTYELGARWRDRHGTLATVTVYQTDFDNKIEKPAICSPTSDNAYHCYMPGVDPSDPEAVAYQGIWQYQNVGEAEVRGVELTYARPLGEHIRLDSSYTYTDSEQLTGDNAGEPLDDQPKHRASVGLTWLATAQAKLWSNARYKGEANQIGEADTPSYTLVDAGLTYDLTPALIVYGGIYNLLDKEVSTETYDRVVDGRRYNLGLTVNF